MIMDLSAKSLCMDNPYIRGKELEEFTRKFNLLTKAELEECLEINNGTFMSVLNQCVQCVGCRRRVERLFQQLSLSGHPTLDPLVVKKSSSLTVTEDKLRTPQALGTLLYRHHEVLNNLLETKLRNKTRCALHSIDAFRSKPFSETWRDVWCSMKHNCRDEFSVIEMKELHEVMENYLKKHKFCAGCRSKIEKAYKILVGENKNKEKGYVAAIFANIKKCHPEKHIHVFTNKIEFLDALIKRAEPEVNGSLSKLRERHAKTLEIAQEEVLTCVGIIMYERLRRAYINLREEERACQLMAVVGIHALCRSFDMFVEKKQGISNLELLYREISRAEKAKELKREQKKLKKKKRKNEKKKTHRLCQLNDNNSDVVDCEQIAAVVVSSESDKEIISAAASSKSNHEDYSNQDDVATNNNDTDSAVELDKSNNTTKTNQSSSSSSLLLSAPPHKKKKSKKQKSKQKIQTNKKKQPSNNSSSTTINKIASKKSLKKREKKEQKPEESALTLTATNKCNDCQSPSSNCPCESDVKDSGYGSEPLIQGNSRTSSITGFAEEDTSDGSEISCSDDCCSHQQLKVNNNKAFKLNQLIELQPSAACMMSDYAAINQADGDIFNNQYRYLNKMSLQQMLDDFDGDDEDEENSCIPAEVLLRYQRQRERVQQQRLELRATLRENFAKLCLQKQRLHNADSNRTITTHNTANSKTYSDSKT